MPLKVPIKQLVAQHCFVSSFGSIFRVFHLVWSTYRATKTVVAVWRNLLRNVERGCALSNKFWLCCTFFIELTTRQATNLLLFRDKWRPFVFLLSDKWRVLYLVFRRLKAPAKRSQLISKQHIATLLGAACSTCLPPCCDVLLQVGCCWLKFENGQIFHTTLVYAAWCCSSLSRFVQQQTCPQSLRYPCPAAQENEIMCGFIAQLVEHHTGIAEVTGSNPVEALIFSGFFFPIA